MGTGPGEGKSSTHRGGWLPSRENMSAHPVFEKPHAPVCNLRAACQDPHAPGPEGRWTHGHRGSPGELPTAHSSLPTFSLQLAPPQKGLKKATN